MFINRFSASSLASWTQNQTSFSIKLKDFIDFSPIIVEITCKCLTYYYGNVLYLVSVALIWSVNILKNVVDFCPSSQFFSRKLKNKIIFKNSPGLC